MNDKSVLVIDDENSVRKIIRDNLKLSGFTVLEASGGEEGLQAINPENPPGVVITDIIMPDKSGLDVIAEIRRKYPSIRLIAMSGGGRIEEANDLLEKAKQLGAHAALSKPLNLDELERMIEELMQ